MCETTHLLRMSPRFPNWSTSAMSLEQHPGPPGLRLGNDRRVFESRVFYWRLIVGIPRTRGLLYSPWQPLGIPFALTPIGQLHQSPPSPIPGDRARGKRRFIPVGVGRDICHSMTLPYLHRPHNSGPIQWAHGGVGLKPSAAARPNGLRWRKKKRTYHSYTTTAWRLSTLGCN